MDTKKTKNGKNDTRKEVVESLVSISRGDAIHRIIYPEAILVVTYL